ncbi:Dicer-like protein 1, partial [Entomortierella beljakovae]
MPKVKKQDKLIKSEIAVRRYCKAMGPQLPIYTTIKIADGYVCELALPPNRIFRVRASSIISAAEEAATIACQTLVMEKEMTNVYKPTPRSSLRGLKGIITIGDLTLGDTEQWSLGLEYIDLENLHIALSPSLMYPTTLGWERLGSAFLKYTRLEKHLSIESKEGRNVLTTAVKRIIAASIIDGGVASAIRTVGLLGMEKDNGTLTLKGLYVQYLLHRPVDIRFPHIMSHTKEPQQPTASTIERARLAHQLLGYNFVDLEVFSNSTSCSGIEFQRLELLGDAVLEILVAEFYFTGISTKEKGLVLSNKLLGSLFVSLGLDNVVVVTLDFEGAIMEAKAEIASGKELESIRVSKSLGDAMEAIIGGIFLDSGFSLVPIREVLNRTLFPYVSKVGSTNDITVTRTPCPKNIVEADVNEDGTVETNVSKDGTVETDVTKDGAVETNVNKNGTVEATRKRKDRILSKTS